MAKKTKLNIDKGLKRIFKVIAPLWGIFLVLAAMINWDKCEPFPNYTPPSECQGASMGGWIFEALIAWVVTTIVAFYLCKGAYNIFKWFGSGFKK
jgi:hypothetical protein